MASAGAIPGPEIAAPYERFREALHEQHGYGVEEEGDRLVLNFSPYFVEAAKPHAQPTLKLRFRRQGNLIVLEDFVVCHDDEERPMSLEAAKEALQIWMDYMCE